MSSILNEAWEWARSRRASAGGGRAVDRSQRAKRSPSLQKALIGSPEPPLGCAPEKRVGEGKLGTKLAISPVRSSVKTASASREEVEKNGSAQRDSNSRGASQDH